MENEKELTEEQQEIFSILVKQFGQDLNWTFQHCSIREKFRSDTMTDKEYLALGIKPLHEWYQWRCEASGIDPNTFFQRVYSLQMVYPVADKITKGMFPE